MALRNSSGEIPDGAVALSVDDAIIYQWEQIWNWPKISDVWPYRIGLPLLTGLAAFSGWKINRMFRRKLKLQNFGLGSTQLAMTLTPPLILGGSHIFNVTYDIFLDKVKCSLCLQHKAVLMQIGAGMVYPLLMSPIANFMFCIRHGTYRLPHYSDHKGNWQMWLKLVKPMRNSLLALLLAHTVSAAFITYMEMKSMVTIRDKLIQFEEKLIQEQVLLLNLSN